ncbi:MAG: YiiX/YebB-like N1pC/P60 family cysteine hydrolase [Bacteroidales bacterium]|nr:YiiX/YebB-like N1pC/P60 family cysteine hydrolase [Bacteroidales bacterium]MDD4669398.1 YiiX/YebB-like N1pC/P60 family cysteine hydrolase [Bacteroidales bacterium]
MKYIIPVVLLMVMVSCNDDIRNGDLLFVRASDSDFSQAIDASTAVDGMESFDHVAIAMVKDGEIYVIEAAPRTGVVCRPFAEFSAESGADNIVMVHPNFKFDTDIVLLRALSYVGRPYDFYFIPTDEALYCSELVYEAFVDAGGNHMFQTVPMNFRAADGTMPQYWVDHFEKTGMKVPEGVQGTNPNQIYESIRQISKQNNKK